jgi:hypothetical protein
MNEADVLYFNIMNTIMGIPIIIFGTFIMVFMVFVSASIISLAYLLDI